MKKIIGITRDGVICSDGKTYPIIERSRDTLKKEGFKNAYLSQVGGFNAVVIKRNC